RSAPDAAAASAPSSRAQSPPSGPPTRHPPPAPLRPTPGARRTPSPAPESARCERSRYTPESQCSTAELPFIPLGRRSCPHPAEIVRQSALRQTHFNRMHSLYDSGTSIAASIASRDPLFSPPIRHPRSLPVRRGLQRFIEIILQLRRCERKRILCMREPKQVLQAVLGLIGRQMRMRLKERLRPCL